MPSRIKLLMSEFFTERLKKLRGNKNKAVFSRELGIPAPMYHRYENGQVPKENNLRVIADHCGVTVDWLLGRDVFDGKKITSPQGAAKLEKGQDSEKGELHRRGVVKLEKGQSRESRAAYGSEAGGVDPGACRLPEGCDIQGELSELREEMRSMRNQLDTVVGLLGAALGNGMQRTRPREADENSDARKAG